MITAPSTATPRPLGILLAGAGTAVLLTAAFPPWNIGFAAWVALAPLLIVIPRLSWRAGEWLGFLTGLAFYAFNFRWFYSIFGFPAVALWGILALFFAVFCVLARTIPPAMPAWQRAMLVGAFWVAVEFLRCEQWPLKFSWLALGYSQHEMPFSPAYSLAGVYGMSFLIVAFSVWMAVSRRFAVLIPAAVLVGTSIALVPHLFLDPDMLGLGEVLAVQSSSPSVAEQKELSEAAFTAGHHPTLVAWPEYTLQQTPEEAPEPYADLKRWAGKHGVTLVFGGVSAREGGKFSSAAYVIGPDGGQLGVYEKHDPLPFFQDGEPGSAYPVFPLDLRGRSLPFGVAICFDLSFERNARRLVENGARFLVIPSEEPPEWPRLEQQQHALIAPVRAAENGVGILRASAPGPSQTVLPDGNVAGRLAVGETGVLHGFAPPALGRTVYNRVGWMFPWLCQAVTALWLLGRATRRRTVEAPSKAEHIL